MRGHERVAHPAEQDEQLRVLAQRRAVVRLETPLLELQSLEARPEVTGDILRPPSPLGIQFGNVLAVIRV